MKRNVLYPVAIVLTLVNLAAFGTMVYHRWSGDSDQPLAEMREQRFDHMKSELNLSSVQIERLDAYRKAFHTHLDTLSSQLAGKRARLLLQLWQTPLDTARVNALVDSISQVQSAAQRNVIAHLLDVNSILNPEQREKFHSIVLQRFAIAADAPMSGEHAH